MKVPFHWVRPAGVAALAVALAWPGAAQAQRRDQERQRDLEVRLRESQDQIANAMRLVRMHASRAQLGVSIEDDDEGARIVSVMEDGAAEEAGLAEEDVIVALDGVSLVAPIEDEDEDDDWGPAERLVRLMADVEPGDVVRVDYTRDGRRASVDVETTERRGFAFYTGRPFRGDWQAFGPDGLFRFRGIGRGFMGADLADVNEGLGAYFGVQEGALVLDVDDDGGLGLRPGDVIVEIGGRDVQDASDAYRILGSYEKGERLRVVVVRERGRVTLEGSAD